MNELEQNTSPTLDEYWQIVCRRRWWLILPAFACWLVVWGGSWFLPAVFRSQSLILIEQQKVPEQYVVSNVSVDLQERLHSMTQQILSRTRLQHIIDDFHLYAKERSRLSPDGLVDLMRDDVKIELVQAPGRPGDLTAFRISYSATSPQLAQQVASQLTSLFIEEDLQAQQQQSENTTRFLENQLADARASLEQQEAKVRQFKTQYLGQLPSQMEGNLQILSGLQNQLESAQQSLSHAQQQRLYLESLLDQYRTLREESAAVASGGVQAPAALESELARQRSQLTDLQARYTDQHPDVIRLKSQIAKTEKLKKQIDLELSAKASTEKDDSTSRSPNPQLDSPLMQIQGQIKANQLEIQNDQASIKELQGRISDYQSRLNMTPVREQQLSDLTRDYEQSKGNYDSLLKKQMQSQLSTNLEKRQQGQQFRIIDPPSLPQKPYSPDHFKLSLIGIGLGIALAIGLTALLELVDVRVRSEKNLKDLIGARVLVSIPRLNTRTQEKRHFYGRWLQWTAALFIVAFMAAGNFVSYYKG